MKDRWERGKRYEWVHESKAESSATTKKVKEERLPTIDSLHEPHTCIGFQRLIAYGLEIEIWKSIFSWNLLVASPLRASFFMAWYATKRASLRKDAISSCFSSCACWSFARLQWQQDTWSRHKPWLVLGTSFQTGRSLGPIHRLVLEDRAGPPMQSPRICQEPWHSRYFFHRKH